MKNREELYEGFGTIEVETRSEFSELKGKATEKAAREKREETDGQKKDQKQRNIKGKRTTLNQGRSDGQFSKRPFTSRDREVASGV